MKLLLRFNPYYQKLNHCFRCAGLCRKRSIGNNVYEVKPVIHAIQRKLNETILTFTIPNGMEPKSVHKSAYAFQQEFGRNTIIDGDLKKFTVHVYKKSMPKSINYSRELIGDSIDGMGLPIILGVDAIGGFQSFDMKKHPHMLIAGATGFGKSSALRAILTTLMLNVSSDDLRFVMGDLKYSELTLFRGYKHVESVNTSAETLSLELSKIRHEMERRGKMLEKAQVTSIDEIGGIPNIIVVIDEVALLKKEKQVMELLEDISAIGRALGVYLILSMQRPDAQILDGKLKNNLTVRMSFKQADKVNSKIILDEAGAEKLPHAGRAVVKISDTQIVQSPFISAAQVKKLLAPLFTQVSSILDNKLLEQESGQQFGMLEDDSNEQP